MTFYTSSRKLTVDCKTKLSMFIFLKSLQQSLANCPYIIRNRFNSFAPERLRNHVTFYINAEKYFQELYEDIRSAKYEIFIRGWWVSPELYLLRPVEAYPESRLDRVLEAAAKRGVKIRIILFKEYKGNMPNDSSYTKKRFESLSSNIRVLRHPSKQEYLLVPKFSMWSHHEKSVVIDQKVGYIGGLDLCYGRFDTENYYICEPKDGSSQFDKLRDLLPGS